MIKVAFFTLGCKVNQCETEEIRARFEAAGATAARKDEQADVCVINTCTVTHTADSKSRSTIRRAIKNNPEALIVVTGCYSELEAEEAGNIDGVDMVVPNARKKTIAEEVFARLDRTSTGQRAGVPALRLRTRAVVKVQDGCDNYCAYCIIPYARPDMTSRPFTEVIDEMERLADSGHKEIVLTGIRLGSYEDSGRDLAGLVERICRVDGIERVRLSSVEPWEVTDRLVDVINEEKVCKHLHIPLQSGSDRVLEMMGRSYTKDEYLRLIERIRKRHGNIGITTDVICGFPGETEEDFQDTLNVVKEAGFSRVHVFRYSKRKGTRAAEIAGQVPEKTKRQRAELLISEAHAMRREFAESFKGKRLAVLFETVKPGDNYITGYADNYVEVATCAGSVRPGSIHTVLVESVKEDATALARIVEDA